MKNIRFKICATALLLVVSGSFQSIGQVKKPAVKPVPKPTAKMPVRTTVAERNVRAQLEFLASDAMQGRGSGSQFERVAAEYIGSQMMQFGVLPAGQKDANGRETYIQTVDVAGRPALKTLAISGAPLTLGQNIGLFGIGGKAFSGELQKLKPGEAAKAGAIVFLQLPDAFKFDDLQTVITPIFQAGAAAVILGDAAELRANWGEIAERRPAVGRRPSLLGVTKEGNDILAALPDGSKLEFNATFAEPKKTNTWNAVGKIDGSDPTLSAEVILLSAHLDHLGVRENAPGEDKIFNGADDDASGCVAVLELARVLASGPRPRRTVYFAFFGSEEAGGFGADYFVKNLAFPKEKLVANLEFEMIGRPDALVKPDELWLTGYERSNLGEELAKRGAKLVQDPHPAENFFMRSDNYTLARQGIIAHTVSSFGLHTDYHHASDETKMVDYQHMTNAINSMVEPVKWLVNSNFVPAWKEGKKP